jgi:acyl-CoA synthetase (AMP-forming)/AMP-acid ligase II
MTEEASILIDMTERMAASNPRKLATVQDDERLDYGTLHDLVLRCVGAFRSRGLKKGDRIGYLGFNSTDHIIALQAALRMGAVMVAINWRLVAREVAYIAADAGLSLLLTEAERVPLAPDGVSVILVDNAHAGTPCFRDWITGFAPDATIADIALSDAAIQLYTSGTTGHPKGAVLMYGNFNASNRQGTLIGERWAETFDDDVTLVASPQFHIAGTGWIITSLNAGATAVLLAKPEPGNIMEAVAEHGITKMFAVPALLNMMLGHPHAGHVDLSSVRALLYGASPIPLDVLKRSMALYPNAAFIQMYGATETTGTVCYLPPEDHDVAGTKRMLGCGKPYPEVELRIVGEGDRDLPVGEVGEVLIRAPMVMSGYHNLPEATTKALLGDWYRTGDAGYCDEDGYLYLFDRVKDMIVSGAENIYPAEVENALHEHPEVRDCAVIGVPDEKWGESVMAVVVRTPGSTLEGPELIAFARERIAGFKIPRQVTFTDELPRNPSGKILKRELRKPYWPEGGRNIG